VIAFVRPDAWDFPLFLHVLGAIALFGGISTLVIVSYAGLRIPEHSAMLRSLAFKATLLVVWPAYIVMRIGAQWILSREGLEDDSPAWVGVGFVISDVGILVLLLLTLLGWLARRRARAGALFAGLSAIYLVALGVAWWAMTTKPT
jgi:hypothetical protein